MRDYRRSCLPGSCKFLQDVNELTAQRQTYSHQTPHHFPRLLVSVSSSSFCPRQACCTLEKRKVRYSTTHSLRGSTDDRDDEEGRGTAGCGVARSLEDTLYGERDSSESGIGVSVCGHSMQVEWTNCREVLKYTCEDNRWSRSI